MMWKTRFGRCIYRSESGIQIFDNFLFRWLTFDSKTLQTLLNKFSPHRAGLYYINALICAANKIPGDCCMLGLGGGAIAHSLSPVMSSFKMTAVELNSEIIELAELYFMTEGISNLEIIHQEANDFVSHCTQAFQHIMVDLFTANAFPGSCYHENFFFHCHRLLLPGGILAINLANTDEQKPIFEMIRKRFYSSTIVIPIKKCTNLVVLACKSERAASLLALIKNTKELKRLNWDETWGLVAELRI